MTDRPDDALLRSILTETKVIALVGASPKPDRPSHGVMRFLQRHGYRVIPVNPGLAGQTLNGERVYASLKEIPRPRPDASTWSISSAIPKPQRPLALEAIDIGAKTVWMQLDVINETAAAKGTRCRPQRRDGPLPGYRDSFRLGL